MRSNAHVRVCTAAALLCVACEVEEPKRAAPDGGPDAGVVVQQDLAFSMPSEIQLAEGASTTVPVRLDAAATAQRQLSVRSLDGYRVSVPGALIFKPGESEAGLQVQSIPDEDTKDDTVTVEVGSGATYKRLSVHITDRGQLSFAVNPAAPKLSEGESTSLSIALSRAPSVDTELSIAVSDPARLSVSTATLSFTPDNYSAPQQLILTALEDEDANQNEVQLRLTADGLAPVVITVQIADQDDQGFVVTALVDTPEGSEQPLSFGLGFAPEEPVRVRFVGTPGILVTPAEVTLSASDYAPKERARVRVSADDNLLDTAAELVLLSSGVSAERALSFTAADPDQQQVLVDGAASASVQVVQGVPDSLQVSLRYQPADAVRVQLGSRASTAEGDADAAQTVFMPTALSFTPDNWNQPQEVRVYPAADGSVDVNVATDDPEAVAAQVRVQVVESAGASGLSLLSSQLSLHPGQEYELPLSLSPARALRLPIVNSNVDCVRTPPELSFTEAEAAAVLRVEARGADCSASLSFGGEFSAAVEVSVTAGEPETPRIIAAPQLKLEEGAQASLTVQLSAAPSEAVQLVVQAPESIQVVPQQLSISDGAAHEILLSAAVDADTLDEAAAIELSALGYLSTTVNATVEDQDGQEIQLSPALLTVDEGFSAEQRVRLAKQPAQKVTITIDAPEGVTAAPASLSFTPDNYATAQAVLLTPAAVDQNRRLELVYSGAGAFKATTLSVRDASTPRLLISRRQLSLSEGGEAQLQLKLSAGSAPVEVAVQNSAPAALSMDPAGPLSVGTTPVTLTLSAPQDDDLLDGAATLSFSSSAGDAALEVEILDDDLSALALSEVDDLSLSEDDPAQTVSVSLSAAPPAPVTVRVFASGAGATVRPASFTLSDTTPQELTVTPVPDADVEDGVLQVRLRADGLSPVGFVVRVQDTDSQALQVVLTDAQATEGSLTDQGALTVALAAPPAGEAVVQLSLDPETAPAVLSATELRFDSTDYNQPQSVSVAATEDSDELDGSVQVKVTLGDLSTTTEPIALLEPAKGPTLYGRSSRKLSSSRTRMDENQVFQINEGRYMLSGAWSNGYLCVNAEEQPEEPLFLDMRLKVVDGTCREGLEIDDGLVVLTRTNYNKVASPSADVSNCVSIKCSKYGRLLVQAKVGAWANMSEVKPLTFYSYSREKNSSSDPQLESKFMFADGYPRIEYPISHGLSYPLQEGGPESLFVVRASYLDRPSCAVTSGPIELSCDGSTYEAAAAACTSIQSRYFIRAKADTITSATAASIHCESTHDTLGTFTVDTKFTVMPQEAATIHRVFSGRAQPVVRASARQYRGLDFSYMSEPENMGDIEMYWRDGAELKYGRTSLLSLIRGEEVEFRDPARLQYYGVYNDDKYPRCDGGWDSFFSAWDRYTRDPWEATSTVMLGQCAAQGSVYRAKPRSLYKVSGVVGNEASMSESERMFFIKGNSLCRISTSAKSTSSPECSSGYAGASSLMLVDNERSPNKTRMVLFQRDGSWQCEQFKDYSNVDFRPQHSAELSSVSGNVLTAASGASALVLSEEAGSLKLYALGFECDGLREIGHWAPPAGSELQAGTYNVIGNGAEALVLATVVDSVSGAQTLVALTTAMDNEASEALTQTSLALGGSRGSAVWASDRWVVSYFTGSGEEGRMHVLVGSLTNIPAELTTP